MKLMYWSSITTWTEDPSQINSPVSQWTEFAVNQVWSWNKLGARLEERSSLCWNKEQFEYHNTHQIFAISLMECKQEKKMTEKQR